MSNFNLCRELALKYSFETFDFKSNSAENFVLYYQEIYNKIDDVLSDQKQKIAKENLELLSKLNF